MRRLLPVATVLGLALWVGAAEATMAHAGDGQARIDVEPPNVTAGDTVVLAGSGLEPDSDRVLVLAGQGLTVEFGTVTTDAEGMFSKELTIPNHLPSGNYELRAIGDETLTVALGVTAAVGVAASAPVAETNETVVPRQRSPVEMAAILGLVVLTAVAGGFLVVRAERFRGTTGA